MTYEFMPGLTLAKIYYNQIIKPLIEEGFPNLSYSAALIGYGSDVLGYDTPRSMDHNWGPRCQIFIDTSDAHMKSTISQYLSDHLPNNCEGFPTNFSDFSSDNTQRMIHKSENPINHLIEIETLETYFQNYYKMDTELWLKAMDQKLLEFTAGEVFYDGLKKLNTLREQLSFYPQKILQLRLAALWDAVANEVAFVGRTIETENIIGLKLIVSRLTNYLIKICFYIDGNYIPYSKWFGRGINELSFSKALKPYVEAVLLENNMSNIEDKLVLLYDFVLEKHNQNQTLPKLPTVITDYYSRPYRVPQTDLIIEKLLEGNEVTGKSIDNLSLIALDIKIDGIDLTE